MPSFILIHPAVWAQYTYVTDRQTGQDRQTDRQDSGPITQGEPFYKRSLKTAEPIPSSFRFWIRIRQVVSMCPYVRTHCCHLANTIEPSVCCGDAPYVKLHCVNLVFFCSVKWRSMISQQMMMTTCCLWLRPLRRTYNRALRAEYCIVGIPHNTAIQFNFGTRVMPPTPMSNFVPVDFGVLTPAVLTCSIALYVESCVVVAEFFCACERNGAILQLLRGIIIIQCCRIYASSCLLTTGLRICYMCIVSIIWHHFYQLIQ